MKFQSENLLQGLSNSEIRNLTTEVPETLVKGFRETKKKVFSAAELWNIHRLRNNTFGKRVH